MRKYYSVIFIITVVSTLITSGVLTYINSNHSTFDSPFLKWMIMLFILLVLQVILLIYIYFKYIKNEVD
ncbi:hypothetical protein AXY_07400 [Amphibacillus xylanus NBRC 15112]|uniref:Uncharacterized protein n=1 Tax=Amphibacillus xylanus (strain ATCC 51415 / DSM 6626 / JCM 7361 / LMG 17667 / NBRC 15112 / Ep01) TaxID=698758 RepID=K0J176_AMPXN|nr:hypothetical protein AXY_07400 [Amphibacillus xylanus NBRC 15112]